MTKKMQVPESKPPRARRRLTILERAAVGLVGLVLLGVVFEFIRAMV